MFQDDNTMIMMMILYNLNQFVSEKKTNPMLTTTNIEKFFLKFIFDPKSSINLINKSTVISLCNVHAFIQTKKKNQKFFKPKSQNYLEHPY